METSDTQLLFPGDAEEMEQKFLMAAYGDALESAVLKVHIPAKPFPSGPDLENVKVAHEGSE